MSSCNHCNQEYLEPLGNPKSDLLIVGEHPSREEYSKGYYLCGRTGDVLRSELRRAGLTWNPQVMRYTTLWGHVKNDNNNCVLDGYQNLLPEMQNRLWILMLGEELSKLFIHAPLIDYIGLFVRMEGTAPALVMFAPSQVMVMYDTVGELRLALDKLRRKVNENRISGG